MSSLFCVVFMTGPPLSIEVELLVFMCESFYTTNTIGDLDLRSKRVFVISSTVISLDIGCCHSNCLVFSMAAETPQGKQLSGAWLR